MEINTIIIVEDPIKTMMQPRVEGPITPIVEVQMVVAPIIATLVDMVAVTEMAEEEISKEA